MKKTLLAAALIAGFASVAHAETSVTLYGILDAGIGYQQVKGSFNGGTDFKAKKTGMINGISNSNLWGLKGTEDLGEGLQAVFQLENGFDLGTGQSGQNSRMFGRQATVGLQSDAWGRLDFGRQSNIASKYLAPVVSPFGVNFDQARAGAAFGAADSVRFDNMVMYQTPNFSGFQAGVGYSFNANGSQNFKTNGGEQPNTRGITTGLRYANGPLAAALTYDQVKTASNFGVAPAFDDVRNGVSIKSWNLGASYDFEVVKVHAGIGQTRNGWITSQKVAGQDNPLGSSDAGIIADGMKVNSYTLGLSAPVGANGKVLASWAVADARNNPNSFTAADKDLSKLQTYSLGYTHALSKRTNVYAIGSYAKHVAFQDDLKSTLVGVGVRHQF